ncbi:uncharacterized protein LOC136075834 [Hydra vulgaris]|uniref:Uncharacterized protein LOC136075834 n=1 Tax=Hydra vulgaris TaxID=6087 RepID=A0ABM4B8Y0_HYDVU
MHIHGYKLYCNNREGCGGGVAIYINDKLNSFEVSMHPLNCKSVEQIGCTYRPPPKHNDDINVRLNFEQAVLASLVSALNAVQNKKFCGMCLGGDFNFNKLTWNKGVAYTSVGATLSDHRFVHTLKDRYIFQVVNFPPFCNSNSKYKSFLDLILTESSNRIYNIEPLPPLCNTSNQYHLSIEWHLATANIIKRPLFVRSNLYYKLADFKNLNLDFKNIDWDVLFTSKNTSQCYKIFLIEYNRLCNKWIPCSKKLIHKTQPTWMNDQLRNLIAKKKHLWILVQQTRSCIIPVLNEYKQVHYQIKKYTKQCIRNYENTIVHNNSKKLLFSYVKSKQKIKNQINAMYDSNNDTITPGPEISNILNSYFKSAFAKEDLVSPMPYFKHQTTGFVSEAVFLEKVISSLSKLDQYKASGEDGVHPWVLKECASTIAYPLTKIFHSSFQEGSVPNAWKIANVTLLHKCRS